MENFYVDMKTTYRWMESELAPTRRGHWWPRCDFFFATLSLTFSPMFLDTIPMMMAYFGGGLYLIGIALVIVFLAYPLMNAGFSLGQFGSSGIISIWNLCPLFKGIGYGIVLLSIMSSIQFSYFASWPLHYLATTILTEGQHLPWATCSNHWNTPKCMEVQLNLENTTEPTPMYTQMEMNQNVSLDPSQSIVVSAEEYYKNRFLVQGDGIDISNVGAIQWEILLSMAAFWVIMFFTLIVGHYSLGKMSYFTTLVPLGLIIAFIVKVIPLKGSVDGLLFVMMPAPQQAMGLTSLTLTARCHLVVIHSFLFGYGCYTMLGSYNRLQYNYHRDSILVIIFTFMFCVLCVAMTSMYVGHYAYMTNDSIGAAMESGPTLMYITMPTLLSSFEMPRLWLSLYFVLIFFLMFGTQMVVTESIVTALADEFFPVRLTKGKRMLFKSLLSVAFCLLMLLAGIPLSTQGGLDVAHLLGTVNQYSPLVLILLSCLVLIWIYGVSKYSYDVKVMLGYKPDYLVLGCLIGVVPLVVLGSLAYLALLRILQPSTYQADQRPWWYTLVSWVICILPLALVPILMIVRLIQAAACPQRFTTSSTNSFCSRVISPTIRWKKQYHMDVSQRQTIIQTPTAPSAGGRSEENTLLYSEVKETNT